MKYIALILILASQALADPVWLHAAMAVGFINKDVDPVELWGELDLQNSADRQETVTISARRYDGALVSAQTYHIAAGEKLSVKVEDPAFNMDMIVEHGKLLPDDLQCVVAIEPAPPTLSISARQLRLHGDKLLTLRLAVRVEQPKTQIYFQVGPEERLPTTRINLSNINGKPKTVLMCQSIVLAIGCFNPPERITVPPFGNISMPFPNGGYGYSYLLVLKPKDLFVKHYRLQDGITSTFEVDSGVTFGSPVEKKDK
jgi:hypothetical protein